MQNELSNIEGCLDDLKHQNNLMTLLVTDYFNRPKVKKEEAWELAWDYKFYQSLVFTISKELRSIESKLDTNVYQMYETIRNGGKKSENN